ncbi:MAG: ATP-binding cassette domain-containing protein [Eubacteriales bacterium]|nr:ATP-binding cassette domain-containing protein [Eubacteriales bacterium]
MNDMQYELLYFDLAAGMQKINLSKFHKERIMVGRDPEIVDIVLPYPGVSRVHGCIYLENDAVFFEDLDSKNGSIIVENNYKVHLHHEKRRLPLSNSSYIYIKGLKERFFFLIRRSVQGEGWKKVAIGGQPLVIGRTAQNDIVLNHPAISKIHARLWCNGTTTFIEDLGSRNGTRINGKFIQGKEALRDFDIIQIFDFQLIIYHNVLYYCTKVAGIHLVANDVFKTVNRGKKCLLNHVNLDVESNDFIAIIGGSGAGKTTLMNAISGFDQDFKGQVLFNGIDMKREFNSLKDMIGYVPQQEIIYENLTLHNMLYYTAKMKMPKDTDRKEIEHRINEVLSMVELTEHQKTYIRKLSGGQKKRASIAVELLADPKLFFLDEPTSGLDPGTEKNLMEMLNRLSKTRDKTTVIVTHTTQNLHLCDKIVFMGPGGYLCFYGNVEQAKEFFMTDDLVNIYNMIAKNPEAWAKRFQMSMMNEQQQENVENNPPVKNKSNVSLMRQQSVLIRRYAELIWNDKIRLAILLLQPVIIALLLSVVAADDVYDIFESTQSMMFSLSCSAIWIGLFNSIQEICKERSVLKREYMANLKLPLYTVSKMVVQTILAAAQAVLLTTVFLKIVGEYREGIIWDPFTAEIMLTVWFTILASMAMGLVISAIVRSGDKAMTLAPFVLIVQLLFSGILFKLEGVGEIISYCTISKWSVEALGSIVNLNGLNLRMQETFPMLEHEAQDIYEHTFGHLQFDWAILIGMTVLFAVISCVALLNLKNDKR